MARRLLGSREYRLLRPQPQQRVAGKVVDVPPLEMTAMISVQGVMESDVTLRASVTTDGGERNLTIVKALTYDDVRQTNRRRKTQSDIILIADDDGELIEWKVAISQPHVSGMKHRTLVLVKGDT